jgi:hypothetical protein
MATLLYGAFHPEGRAFEQRRVAVTLDARVSPSGFFARRIDLAGHIEAEGIARRAPCRGTCTQRGRAITVELVFETDAGRPAALVVALRISRFGVRRLTELTGELRVDGAVLGPAILRIDWRRLAPV